MRLVIVLLAAWCGAGVLVSGGSASAAEGKALDACDAITLADARQLIGPSASLVPGTEPACLYTTVSAPPLALAPSLLVQVTRRSGPPRAPSFGTRLEIPGTKVCWHVPLQGTNVGCFARGRLVAVNVVGTPDDLATATAAMKTALGNLSPTKR